MDSDSALRFQVANDILDGLVKNKVDPLAGVELDPKRAGVVRDVLSLYESKANWEIINRTYAQESSFEDPFTIAIGRKEIAAQWVGLAKLFPNTQIVSVKVIEDSKSKIEFWLETDYATSTGGNGYVGKAWNSITRGKGLQKRIKSKVILDLSIDGVTRHQDLMNGKELPDGAIAHKLRRLNGKHLPKIVHV